MVVSPHGANHQLPILLPSYSFLFFHRLVFATEDILKVSMV